jgi:hypothetical protein
MVVYRQIIIEPSWLFLIMSQTATRHAEKVDSSKRSAMNRPFGHLKINRAWRLLHL